MLKLPVELRPARADAWTGFEVAAMVLHEARKLMGELISKVKGKVKQVAGKMTRNKNLEQRGSIDVAKGRANGAVEHVKRVVKRAAKK
jgi:uncharacterized protein YjbJ (UPF0337 family)